MIRDTNHFLSKLCTVLDAFFRILDVQIHVFFWSNKTAYRISFFWFLGSSEKLGVRGIDPCTSLAKRGSTIWATSLVRKRAAHDKWSLSFVSAMVEQFCIAFGCKNGFVDAGHQSMCFSHASRLPSLLTCLAGGVHMSCLCQSDVFDSLVSIVMFPPTSFWGKIWRFRARLVLSQQALYCFRCFLLHIGRTNPYLVLV